jgi:hypothetical protein
MVGFGPPVGRLDIGFDGGEGSYGPESERLIPLPSPGFLTTVSGIESFSWGT